MEPPTAWPSERRPTCCAAGGPGSSGNATAPPWRSLFERGIAPLLEQIDLEGWSVVIFGDHGESWTPDELYHGRTLRNPVLRVPLWVHAPAAARPAGPGPGEVVGLIDLHATARGLCGLGGMETGLRPGPDPRPGGVPVLPGRDSARP